MRATRNTCRIKYKYYTAPCGRNSGQRRLDYLTGFSLARYSTWSLWMPNTWRYRTRRNKAAVFQFAKLFFQSGPPGSFSFESKLRLLQSLLHLRLYQRSQAERTGSPEWKRNKTTQTFYLEVSCSNRYSKCLGAYARSMVAYAYTPPCPAPAGHAEAFGRRPLGPLGARASDAPGAS